jgi:hypothetical protein
MGKDEIIHVNRFCFCEDHGSELCNTCGTDLRIVNNITMGDAVLANLRVTLGARFNFEVRERDRFQGAVLIFAIEPSAPEGLRVWRGL